MSCHVELCKARDGADCDHQDRKKCGNDDFQFHVLHAPTSEPTAAK